jgi:hypothetical protein
MSAFGGKADISCVAEPWKRQMASSEEKSLAGTQLSCWRNRIGATLNKIPVISGKSDKVG